MAYRSRVCCCLGLRSLSEGVAYSSDSLRLRACKVLGAKLSVSRASRVQGLEGSGFRVYSRLRVFA